MKQIPVHYSSSMDILPECNPNGVAEIISLDPDFVTCGRCRLTQAFKRARAADKSRS